MTFPRARLVVSALLFLGWLLFLLWLVLVTRDTIVVSRPQLLVANLIVLAEIKAGDGKPATTVTVTDVLWPAQDRTSLLGRTLELDELADVGAAQGWTGADVYLLPLTKWREEKEARYALTPLPPMPGFHPPRGTTRIYKKTDDVIRQVREVKPDE